MIARFITVILSDVRYFFPIKHRRNLVRMLGAHRPELSWRLFGSEILIARFLSAVLLVIQRFVWSISTKHGEIWRKIGVGRG